MTVDALGYIVSCKYEEVPMVFPEILGKVTVATIRCQVVVVFVGLNKIVDTVAEPPLPNTCSKYALVRPPVILEEVLYQKDTVTV